MLDNFLNKTKPINSIGILVLFFLCFFSSIFTKFYVDSKLDFNLLEYVLFGVFFIISFFFVNFIVSKNNLSFDNSYTFFFYSIFLIVNLNYILSFKLLILNIIYLFVLRKVYSLHSQKKIFEKTFDAGFWLGLLFILDSFSIIFLPLIFFGLLIYKRQNFNTLILASLGFLTPNFLYFTYLYWNDSLDTFFNQFNFNINFSLLEYFKGNSYIFFLSMSVIILIFATIKSIKVLSVNNTFRKNWILVLINLTLSLILVLVYNPKSYGILIFITFPVSVVFANAIELINKKLMRDIILYLILVSSLIFKFFL